MVRVDDKERKRFLQKIRRGACLAFENAIGLHEDGVLLYKRKRYASA